MKINNGVYTALVTPFLQSGEVDYDSLLSLVDHQWKNGIKSFVVNGTTAESPTLEEDEVKKIFECVKSYNNEAFVLLGTGSNCTKKTIEKTVWAQSLGCDGALVVVPYYNKPTQEGLCAHFKQVASSVKFPIVLYNVPGRTVISMDAKTTSRLSEVKNIMATKEASGDISLMKKIKEQSPSDFKIFSGDDDSCLQLCLNGGQGVISVMSHLIPAQTNEMIKKSMSGDRTGLEEFTKYSDLLKYLYIEPNPVPAKMALYHMGVIKSAKVRLPLLQMTEKNSNNFKLELDRLGLI